jgi:hypothetical protein
MSDSTFARASWQTKRMWIVILFLLTIIVSIQLYYFTKKPSIVWITAYRLKNSHEPTNVSLEEIKEFTALLNALENAEKYGHYTDAFSLNSSDADKLLDIIKSKSSHVIKQHIRNQNYVVYHFYVKIIDNQQIYAVSINYREKKPLIF